MTLVREEYIPKSMEAVNCTLCDSNDFSHHENIGPLTESGKRRYDYVKCSKCQNVYLNPRPTYDEDYLLSAYDQYGMGNDIVKTKGVINDKEREILNRYQITLKQLKSEFNKSGSILDIGCGTGEFLLAAKELGWKPHGIDISAPMCQHIRENLDLEARSGQFHEMDLSSWGKMDVIFSSHVIEHVPFPNAWMQTFHKVLKDDGILCLNIPNQYAPEKIVQRTLKKVRLRKDEWENWRTPDHLYEPHIESMKYLHEKNNFEILKIETYSSREVENPSPFYNFFYKNLKFGSKLRIFSRKKK